MTTIQTRLLKQVLIVVALLAICAGGWGCSSSDPKSGKAFASVTITQHSKAEIEKETERVLKKHSFAKVATLPGADMVFEREASWWETFTYGGWLGKVWVRVLVYVDAPEPGTWWLGCQAFMVQDKEDGLVEDDLKLSGMRRGAYQEMMDEVKASLSPNISNSN
jgi:hypothetical protein